MRNFFSLISAAVIAVAASSPAQAQTVNRNDPWRPDGHDDASGLRAQRRAAAEERRRLMIWPANLRMVKSVDYVPGSHEVAHQLDLFIPTGPTSPDASPASKERRGLPLVVHIHGGGWSAGDKEQEHIFVPLLHQGYAVAAINYRLSGEALWPAQIYDCKAAIRWLRAHAQEYGINPDKIGVWGESAGGHLAAMIATTSGENEWEGNEGNLQVSSRVQAVCDWFGPSDLVTLVQQSGKPISLDPHEKLRSAREFTEGLLGGKVENHLNQARQASPITYVSKTSAPILIMHGDRDTLVPPAQSTELYMALKAKNADATLHIVQGAGHGGPQFYRFDIRKQVSDFFDWKLKGVHPAGTAQATAGANRRAAAPASESSKWR
jgi:acetyl esterase/lipase